MMATIDEMDRGIDLVRVALMALRSNEWSDTETIESIRNTIDQGLSALAPVRQILNEHGTVDRAMRELSNETALRAGA